MTVYAVQSPSYYDRERKKTVAKFDLSPAEKFGPVEELLSPTAKPFNPAPLIDEMYMKLESFGDEDYIICIGNPILISLAVSIAMDVNQGRAKLLQWNGKRQEYVPVEADMGFTTEVS